jgi:glycosyltransferase involved in cell wall biosynthesis
MKKRRILLATRYQAFMKTGGGEIELHQFAAALKKARYETQLYGPDSDAFDSFDAVLYFSLSPHGYELLDGCAECKIPFLLFPNAWIRNDTPTQTIAALEHFVAQADLVIYKSASERENLLSRVSSTPKAELVVPWGIDESFLAPVFPDRFKRLYGLQEFLLTVGLLEAEKQQHLLFEAASKIALPIVSIGGFRHRDYYQLCKETAGANAIFIGWLQPGSEILRSAYAACRAYAEVSPEPAGLSAFEAACFGRPLALPRSKWADEHFGQNYVHLLPPDQKQIRGALETVVNLAPENPSLSELIQTRNVAPHNLRPLTNWLAQAIK